MIRMTPLRRINLHFSQRGFTDERTFIGHQPSFVQSVNFPICQSDPRSFVPVGYPSPRQIVGGQFQGHTITGEYLDEMHSHLAGHMSQHLVPVIKLHLEHGIRQWFQDPAFDGNRLFLRQPTLSLLRP